MENLKKILVTGGLGFIGGHLVDRLIKETDSKIYNLDYLGYASNPYRFNNSTEIKRVKITLSRKEIVNLYK